MNTPSQTPPRSADQVAADALTKAGWFFPAYLSRGYVMEIARKVRDAPPDERTKVLEVEIAATYSEPKHLAVMVEERYLRWPYIEDHAAVVSEVFEAHALGLHHVATTALLPVVEGTLRGLATTLNLPPQRRGMPALVKRVLVEIEKRLEAVENEQVRSERLVLIHSFRTFVEERFWQNTKNLPSGETLNRHSILHGLAGSTAFARALNFGRLVSVLDMLCFWIAFFPPHPDRHLSALPPDPTMRSIVRAQHYDVSGTLAAASRAASAKATAHIASVQPGGTALRTKGD